MSGIPSDNLSFIAGARNRSVAVKDLSLTVLNDELDWLIVDEFNVAGFDKEIAWRQNAEGDVTGEEVLVYLSLLNPKIADKTRCYVGAGSIVKGLRTPDQMSGLKSAIERKSVRWMKFIDFIHSRMEEWWIKYKEGRNEGASFGKLEAVQKNGRNLHKLVFLRGTQDYRVAKSWLMPIAFGFSTAFQHESNDDVLKKLANDVGPKLMENIYGMTVDQKLNLNAVGKNKSTWTSSEALVQAAYHRIKFEDLSRARG